MKYTIALIIFVSTLFCGQIQAASKAEIDATSQETMSEFYKYSPAGKALAAKAAGILVFPKVIKAGFGLGGEYGEGSLMIGGAPSAYYATAGASFGFQMGAQIKSQVILFMTSAALKEFRNSEGWKAGVDGSVAIANYGVGGDIDTKTMEQPVIGFIFSNKGLMYDLSLEGSKFTQIKR